jgi:hypothetical protein
MHSQSSSIELVDFDLVAAEEQFCSAPSALCCSGELIGNFLHWAGREPARKFT